MLRKMTPFQVISVLLLSSAALAAPADEPIRIDLPVYDPPEGTNVEGVAMPLEPENYPGGELVKAPGGHGNFVTYKLQAASNILGNSLSSKAEGGIFGAPVTTRETVLQETEDLGSKTLSFKENIEGFVGGLFQPKPIVDTISESEKYGNTGDKFYSAGKAIVGGAENLSTFVNSVLELPGTLFKTITKTATQKLNNLGGKLIGL